MVFWEEHQTNPMEENSTKYLTNTIQKCQSYQKEEKSNKLSQTRGD